MSSNSFNPLQDSTNQGGKKRAAPNKQDQEVKVHDDESHMSVSDSNRGTQPALACTLVCPGTSISLTCSRL